MNKADAIVSFRVPTALLQKVESLAWRRGRRGRSEYLRFLMEEAVKANMIDPVERKEVAMDTEMSTGTETMKCSRCGSQNVLFWCRGDEMFCDTCNTLLTLGENLNPHPSGTQLRTETPGEKSSAEMLTILRQLLEETKEINRKLNLIWESGRNT